jgi:hypothetical protein
MGRPFDLKRVVVNFANVGSTYGVRVMKRTREQGLMDYEGVRRCLNHLVNKQRLKVVGVVFENFRAKDGEWGETNEVPEDIAQLCETIELTPRICGQHQRSADDEMTIKCAYRRNCRLLDNDNYRDWKQTLRDEEIRAWLDKHQDILQMRYYFDTGLGEFDTLDGNVPVEQLALSCKSVQRQPAGFAKGVAASAKGNGKGKGVMPLRKQAGLVTAADKQRSFRKGLYRNK